MQRLESADASASCPCAAESWMADTKARDRARPGQCLRLDVCMACCCAEMELGWQGPHQGKAIYSAPDRLMAVQYGREPYGSPSCRFLIKARPTADK